LNPHTTTWSALTEEQVGEALVLVLDHLRIKGWLDAGVEDGTTAERWTEAREALAGP
jgi:hypothetical protein